jgi:hypothetical protein
VLPTIVDPKSAFEFSQNLEIVYRETAKTPPVTSKATQQGFLFVESKLEAPGVCRLMTQNLLTPQSLNKLRTLLQTPRKPYGEEHLRLFFSLNRPFGLELPLEFTTDLLGSSAIPTGEPKPGNPKPAIPYEVLHFPYITPALSNGDVAVGKSWKSFINVRCGFGRFALPYSAKWSARDLVTATAEMTFDPPNQPEKPAVFNGVNLLFHATGTWTVAYSLMDGAPMRAKGALQYIVPATVPPAPQITEVINAKLTFQWRKVPVGFSRESLMTASWGALPSE